MNYGDSKSKATKLINEYSNKGAIVSDTKNADYLLRFPDAAQSAQMEIATVKKIHAVYNFSQNAITPLGGRFSGFDEVQFLGDDYQNDVGQGAKAYYFEVDKQSTVYIEEETSTGVWTNLSTITVPNTVTYFTAYKGLITPSVATNNVRLRFSGTYPYNIRNRALWAYTFASASEVPDYRPYVKYTLPTNAMEIKKIIQETENRQYGSLSDYFVEGKTTIVVNYYYVGSFRVEYFQYPTTIDSTTLDSFDFELDKEAQELIPYKMGGQAMLDDKETRSFGVILLNQYQSMLANLSTEQNASFAVIADVNNW